MLSPSEFARQMGVSKQAVSKAIKAGRIPVYDETGARCPADYEGRKFIDLEEGRAAFRLSRSRVDDHMLAEIATETAIEIDSLFSPTATHDDAQPSPAQATSKVDGTLASAKTDKERLQADLLRLRLAKERGELIPRTAQLDAFEQAGRRVANELQSISQWAEQITSVAHVTGVAGVTAFLRSKGNELCERLAEMMTTDQNGDGNDDGRDGGEPD